MTARSSKPDDAERLALLRRLNVLDTPAEAAFDALVASAARITGCAFAAISLVDAHRLWFKARIGFERDGMPREGSFCGQAIQDEALLEVPDLRTDARFRAHPLVAGEPHLRFYAGQPLKIGEHRIGTLCVLDAQPRDLRLADRRLLAQLAEAVVELLMSRQRLRDAEEGRQRLLDFGRAGGDWMWESDAEHRYLWMSDSFESRTGLLAADQIGQPISDGAVLGADGQPAQPPQRYREILERRLPFTRVLTAKPSPRGVLLLSRSAVPVFDAAGRFAGYRGTIRDVTGQLRANARLHERDERLGKLASQVPGIIFQYQWHADGRSSYPYASERTREILEVEPPRDGNGGDPTVPYRLLHPDDRDDFERSISESARTLTPWLREYRVVRSDGSVRWLDTFATPERLADGSVLWHGFTADITARKETEAALDRKELQWQLASQAARVGLVQLSLADGLVRLDAQARANHGINGPLEAFSLDAWMVTIDPPDRAGAQAGVSKLLHDGTAFEGRYRVHRPDGSVRWLEFVMRASRDVDGRIDGLIGTCRDVHDQQTAAQLERARVDAERASRAKSEFLSRLSHELRTPLNGILGFAQLMAIDREQPLTGRQAQRLASMQHASSHLLGLINDVLEISRNDGSEPGWQVQRVEIDAAIESTMGLVHPLAQLRHVHLQREPSPAAGPGQNTTVLGEPRRIEQVLMNLLSNAIKYSPPRSCVTVRVIHSEAATRVSVSDEGHGIDAAQIARLFQPFERLDAERRQVDGVGLGLFIARQLAEAMGGRIEVASRVGVGSTFTLVLRREPVAVADAAPPAAASAAPVETSAAVAVAVAAPPATPKHIVYVEDESLNQLLLQEVLRSRAYWHLHLADDGAEGLELARELRPDVMLIDINLPDMTGLALVAKLRADERTRALRCVALSADAMSEQIEAARRAGFDDYWTKPIDVAQVLSRLDALLREPG